MDFITDIFRHYPVIPIFLTIGIGFWIGRLKYKIISLGVIPATLLTGVLIGQLDIPVPDLIKNLFFILFLFSIGYSAGPHFFHALKGHGLKQVLFAVVEAMVCGFTVLAAAKLMHYNTGEALGLFAGSQTASASLGFINDTVNGLSISEAEKSGIREMVPVCYAVTYVFGAIGSAWFLSIAGPMMLGGLKKVKEEAAEMERCNPYEHEKDKAKDKTIDDDKVTYNNYAAYRLTGDYFDKPRTIRQVERKFNLADNNIFIVRLRINGVTYDHPTDMKMGKGDVIVLTGRASMLDEKGRMLGEEIHDIPLTTFRDDHLNVTVSSPKAVGKTFAQLRSEPYMQGVGIREFSRNSTVMPPLDATVVLTGDNVTLTGQPGNVMNAAANMGYTEIKDTTTDMVSIGLAIAIGCFLGALSFKLESIPITLSTTGGALLMGLILGWWRNRHPRFGNIPPAVIWFLDNMGLNLFVAAVGIIAGPSFLPSLKSVGFGLFLVGMATTLIPLAICIIIGSKVFRFKRPETLGCVAGARLGAATIGAIQDAIGSTVPMIGYSVTYAVANFLLVFASLIVLFIA
jgi:putative transport protein